MNNRHNIVYITDSGYFFPTKVSIRSAIRNSEDHDITIFVIASELNDGEISALEKLQTDKAKIQIISIKDVTNDNIPKHHYVSKTSLLKFKLAEILDKLDKILYIDGDTLLYHGYLSIFDYNIEEYYMGAVKDICTQTLLKRNEYIGNKAYFNSGVMLLNLKKIREDKCVEKLINNKNEDPDNTFMDQDTINKIFGNRTLCISPTYNFLAPITNHFTIDEFADFYSLEKYTAEKIFYNPFIFHLAGEEKPWNSALCDHIDKWFMFLDEKEKNVVVSNYFVNGALRKKMHNLDNRELRAEIYMNNKFRELDEKILENDSLIRNIKNDLDNMINYDNISEKRIDSNQEYIIKLLNNTKDLQNQITDLNHKLNYYKNRTLFGTIKRIVEKLKGE